MIKKAMPLILSVMLFATALCASALEEEQKAIASSNIARPTDESTQSSNNGPASHLTLQRRNPRYELCRGDVFDLDFPFTPEFNQQMVTVQPDGYISLRGVGDLHVEGQTIPELKEKTW